MSIEIEFFFLSVIVTSPERTSPVRGRCFVPINGIPDLRSKTPNKELNKFKSRFQPEMSRSKPIMIVRALRSFPSLIN